jgi:uncharacterized membrane protein
MKSFNEFIAESYNEEEEDQPGIMSGIADAAQGVLSAASLVDPTQAADALNTGISLTRGLVSKKSEDKKKHYTNAALFGVSMIPGIGDAAKLGVYGPAMAKIASNPNVAKILASKGLITLTKTAGDMAKTRVSSGVDY